MTAGTVGVAIVTYRDRFNLERCLRSVVDTTVGLDVRVTVFDNDSGDGTVAMVREQFPSVRLIESPQNVGLTKGLNRCIGTLDAGYVLALDSDTIVGAGAVEALASFIATRPDLAAVGGRLFYLDGRLQETARGFPSAMNGVFGRHTALARVWPNNPVRRRYLMANRAAATAAFETDWVSAACMMINRRAWQDVGGFDERFFVYWCDADFCFRCRQAGYSVACLPTAKVIHCEQFHPGRKKSPRMIKDFHEGVYRFYRSHYAPSRLSPMGLVARVGLGLRMRMLLAVNATRSGAHPRAMTGSAPIDTGGSIR
jgi:N-acetylglucosaminyl-diphospho-decaprenol L-rhamnosyltransferase